MGKEIKINNQVIAPGEEALININVGKLPIGHRIYIKVNVYNAEKEGPVVLFMGGLHGDEVNGVETLKRAIHSGVFKDPDCGTVIAISLLNVYGFLNFSRSMPDGKDVNRSFPGNANGSLASRVAAVLSRKILPIVDFGVDFHTGADNRYNYPQIRINPNDDTSVELARAFNAPIYFPQNVIAKSFRKTAKNQNIPIIVYEGGEALRLDEYAINVAMEGIKNMLSYFNIKSFQPTIKEMVAFDRSSWIRASVAGLFNSFYKSGQYVEKGVPIGSISDPFGDSMRIVSASRDGFIIGHNNLAVVNQGDALFHIAYHNK